MAGYYSTRPELLRTVTLFLSGAGKDLKEFLLHVLHFIDEKTEVQRGAGT